MKQIELIQDLHKTLLNELETDLVDMNKNMKLGYQLALYNIYRYSKKVEQ